MDQIRIGIIGMGFIGKAHIEAVRRLGFVEIAAVCDNTDPERTAAALHIAAAYRDHREMIDKEHLDAVHICTPNFSHFEIASYAITHGLHVICEKPMTFTVEEAEELTRLAEQYGVVNAVNFHCRYYPMVRQMREMVRKDDLGRLLSIHGGYYQDWLLLDTDYSWRLESGQSGASRAVADIGSHWVDSVEFITGRKIKRVFADFATFHKTRKRPIGNVATFSNKLEDQSGQEEFQVDTEDFAQVLLEFEGGVKGNMIVSQMYAGRKNQMIVSVAGTESALHWDSEQLNDLWQGRRTGYNSLITKDPALLEGPASAICGCPGGHVEGFPDAFLHNFRAIYDCIRAGTPGEFATFRDGMREMKLCQAMVDSAHSGAWVEVAD